jgi:hypothetical protein
MPIDKFGRHMLKHNLYQPTNTSPLSSVYLCDPKQLYSICVLNVTDEWFIKEKGNMHYFTCPVDGRLVSHNILPENIDIKIVDGVLFKKGERIAYNKEPNSPPVNMLLVLACPLVKDE